MLLALVVGLASLAFLVGVLQKRSGYYRSNTNESSASGSLNGSPTAVAYPPSPTTVATAAPSISTNPPFSSLPDSATPLPENALSPNPSPPQFGFAGKLKLILPVAGVRPDQLHDTFADSRSEGRVHDAIDIPAPLGTPVFAAADGEILRLFASERGGTTIYQLSTDKKLVFYYAHLQRYAEGLAAGKVVHQGDVIAYVGDTGNAGAGNYHLHFSIAVVADPKRSWEGVNINPYPMLRELL